jgi:hypothetical protein
LNLLPILVILCSGGISPGLQTLPGPHVYSRSSSCRRFRVAEHLSPWRTFNDVDLTVRTILHLGMSDMSYLVDLPLDIVDSTHNSSIFWWGHLEEIWFRHEFFWVTFHLFFLWIL